MLKFIGLIFICIINNKLVVAQAAPSGHYPPAQVVLDIAYVPGGVEKQKLDLYTPARNGFPVIMFIHGGSLTEGDRKNQPDGLPYDSIAKRFQADGIGFAVISYRLGPDIKWPSQPDDCVAAFDWLKKNIWSYGGNPKRIFVMGHSSGAFLTYMLAFDPKYLDKKGYTQKDIAGALPMGAKLEHFIKLPEGKTETDWQKIIKEKNQATDLTFGTLAIYNDANPIIYLNREIPPTLILIAEDERFTPPILEQAAYFVRRAKHEFKIKADLKILDGEDHMTAISNMVKENSEAYKLVKGFVETSQ